MSPRRPNTPLRRPERSGRCWRSTRRRLRRLCAGLMPVIGGQTLRMGLAQRLDGCESGSRDRMVQPVGVKPSYAAQVALRAPAETPSKATRRRYGARSEFGGARWGCRGRSRGAIPRTGAFHRPETLGSPSTWRADPPAPGRMAPMLETVTQAVIDTMRAAGIEVSVAKDADGVVVTPRVGGHIHIIRGEDAYATVSEAAQRDRSKVDEIMARIG